MSFKLISGPNQDNIETKPNHEAMTLLLARQFYHYSCGDSVVVQLHITLSF